ncbi:MAG: dienelactone hydrolase family protein [Planctomycetota bacterium]
MSGQQSRFIIKTDSADPPHGGMPVSSSGSSIETAGLVVILLHGRGGNAREMLALAEHFECPDAAFIAPQAAGFSWYPESFLAPFEVNQPGIDSAHNVIESLIDSIAADRSSPSPIALLGFSQGACLAVDHAYRFPRRYAFIAGLTGGIIGPPGTAFDRDGALNGTPILLGSGDPDPHVPWSRVRESADVLEGMGGNVELVRYENAPHAVLPDQVDRVRELARAATVGGSA